MLRLKQRLDGGATLPMAWCGLADPRYLEIVASHGFGAVVLDMQHGFFDEASIQHAIAAVAAKGNAPLVRIPLGRWDTASRAMDFGALGIIAPMINSAEDARAFAKAVKYVPTGERSFGPRHAASVYGVAVETYLTGINDAALALPMIETREAVTALDAILEVDGIDGILIGPGDLSISLRQNPVPDAYGPDSMDAVNEISTKTIAAGKLPTAFAHSPADANMLAGMGFRLIAVGEDGAYLDSGLAAHIGPLDFV